MPSGSILAGDTSDWLRTSAFDLKPSLSTGTFEAVGNQHRKGINLTWADGHSARLPTAAIEQGWLRRRAGLVLEAEQVERPLRRVAVPG